MFLHPRIFEKIIWCLCCQSSSNQQVYAGSGVLPALSSSLRPLLLRDTSLAFQGKILASKSILLARLRSLGHPGTFQFLSAFFNGHYMAVRSQSGRQQLSLRTGLLPGLNGCWRFLNYAPSAGLCLSSQNCWGFPTVLACIFKFMGLFFPLLYLFKM